MLLSLFLLSTWLKLICFSDFMIRKAIRVQILMSHLDIRWRIVFCIFMTKSARLKPGPVGCGTPGSAISGMPACAHTHSFIGHLLLYLLDWCTRARRTAKTHWACVCEQSYQQPSMASGVPGARGASKTRFSWYFCKWFGFRVCVALSDRFIEAPWSLPHPILE